MFSLLRQKGHLRRPFWGGEDGRPPIPFELDAKPCTAFGAARSDDLAATLALHSAEKAMLTGALAFLGLESSFHVLFLQSRSALAGVMCTPVLGRYIAVTLHFAKFTKCIALQNKSIA